MIFAKFDVRLASHPRALRAEEEAPGCMSLYLWSILYVRSHDESGAFEKSCIRLSWVTKRLISSFSKALVSSGLWIDNGSSYEIYKYGEKNETKEEIDKRRSVDRERKKKDSERNPSGIQKESIGTPVGFPDSDSGSGSVVVLEEGSGEKPLPPETSPKGAHERYAKAYADGQIAAGAQAYPWESMKADHGALAQMCAFAIGKRGAELEAWFTETSLEFRGAVDATYNPGFTPRKCLEWLKGARPRKQSNLKLVQPVPETGRLWKVGDEA